MMPTMTDRELLELAAKAAGYDAFEGHAAQMVDAGWNSLTDGGDALRLAAKLGMGISFRTVDVCVTIGNRSASEYTPNFRSDEEAACRAITRLAAEIGKAMKEVK